MRCISLCRVSHEHPQTARQLAGEEYNIPLIVVDVEMQFDRAKYTVYYVSDGRVDFRELVRELVNRYKIRVWMQQVAGTAANVASQHSVNTATTAEERSDSGESL